VGNYLSKYLQDMVVFTKKNKEAINLDPNPNLKIIKIPIEDNLMHRTVDFYVRNYTG